MIVTRSPLRITLGGGGTDLPSYYTEYGGFLIAAAINKYVYVSVTKPFDDKIRLKYSETETVDSVEEIRHPIIKECLQLLDIKKKIEIVTLADVPSGTGLGSSGSFTTALLKALHVFKNRHVDDNEIASLACHVEIERLREPIGKQDQFISALGGVKCIEFHQDGSVSNKPLSENRDSLNSLQEHLMLFFSGQTRSASSILMDQNVRSSNQDVKMLANLHKTKEMARTTETLLQEGKFEQLGLVMHEHWMNKKARSNAMSNDTLNQIYDLAMENGAIGGKVVGAGGGGFFLFVTNDRLKLRQAMIDAGLSELQFNFDYEGIKTLFAL